MDQTLSTLCRTLQDNTSSFISSILHIRTQYRSARLDISNLRDRLASLHREVNVIQVWIESQAQIQLQLSDDERRVFDDLVRACGQFMETLREAADTTLGMRDGSSTWARVKDLWEQAALGRYLATMNQQYSAVKFLVLVLKLPNSEARMEQLRARSGALIISGALHSAAETSTEIRRASESIFGLKSRLKLDSGNGGRSDVSEQTKGAKYVEAALNSIGISGDRTSLGSPPNSSPLSSSSSRRPGTPFEAGHRRRSSDRTVSAGSFSPSLSYIPDDVTSWASIDNMSTTSLSSSTIHPDDSASNIGFGRRTDPYSLDDRLGKPSTSKRQGIPVHNIERSNQKKTVRMGFETNGSLSGEESDKTVKGTGMFTNFERRKRTTDLDRFLNKADKFKESRIPADAKFTVVKRGRDSGYRSSSGTSIASKKDNNGAPRFEQSRLPKKRADFESGNSESSMASISSLSLLNLQNSLSSLSIDDDDNADSFLGAVSSVSSFQDSIDGIRARLSGDGPGLNANDAEEIKRLLRTLEDIMRLMQRLCNNDAHTNREELANVKSQLERMMREVQQLLRDYFPDRKTIHEAASQADAEAVARLIRMGINPNTLNDAGDLPLCVISFDAPVKKIVPTYRALLEGGANPNATCTSGRTPLMAAAQSCYLEAIELLITHGGDVNKPAINQLSPLQLLCHEVQNQKGKTTRLLLENGADPNATSPSGKRALDFALEAMQYAEKHLETAENTKPSTLYYRCQIINACMESIAVLLEHQRQLVLTPFSANNLHRTYSLRELTVLIDGTIEEARLGFRQRRVSILLMSDLELYNAVHNYRITNNI